MSLTNQSGFDEAEIERRILEAVEDIQSKGKYPSVDAIYNTQGLRVSRRLVVQTMDRLKSTLDPRLVIRVPKNQMTAAYASQGRNRSRPVTNRKAIDNRKATNSPEGIVDALAGLPKQQRERSPIPDINDAIYRMRALEASRRKWGGALVERLKSKDS